MINICVAVYSISKKNPLRRQDINDKFQKEIHDSAYLRKRRNYAKNSKKSEPVKTIMGFNAVKASSKAGF